MIPEKRFCEIRAEGRTLEGDAIVYGDEADFPWGRETIEPGAFAPLGDVILNRQHDRKTPLARTGGGGLSLEDSREALRIRAELPATSSADETLSLVRGKILRGLSVEFFPVSERQKGDLRIIEKAHLVAVAVVDSGQYPASEVQARALEMESRARSGRSLSFRIPAGRKLACRCSGVGCKFAKFQKEAIEQAMDKVFARAHEEITASFSSYDQPLASIGKGTIRRRGKLGATIDIPTGQAGDAVLEAHENAGVIVRPFLDSLESKGKRVGDVVEYEKAEIRSFIVSATDQREGWPPAEIINTPKRRARRLWL